MSILVDTFNSSLTLYSTAGCFRANGCSLNASNTFVGPTGVLVVPSLYNNHRRILTTPDVVFDAAFIVSSKDSCTVVETFEFTISLDGSELPNSEGGPAEFLLVFKRWDQKVMPVRSGGGERVFLTKCGRDHVANLKKKKGSLTV